MDTEPGRGRGWRFTLGRRCGTPGGRSKGGVARATQRFRGRGQCVAIPSNRISHCQAISRWQIADSSQPRSRNPLQPGLALAARDLLHTFPTELALLSQSPPIPIGSRIVSDLRDRRLGCNRRRPRRNPLQSGLALSGRRRGLLRRAGPGQSRNPLQSGLALSEYFFRGSYNPRLPMVECTTCLAPGANFPRRRLPASHFPGAPLISPGFRPFRRLADTGDVFAWGDCFSFVGRKPCRRRIPPGEPPFWSAVPRHRF